MCVRCTIGTRKVALATGCQVKRNGRGHSAETLTLKTAGDPLGRGQTPLTVAQSRALTAGNSDSVMRAPEACFRKGQVACPWGPRQLSDTITYKVQKHIYKDTLIHRGKVKQRGTEVELQREMTGVVSLDRSVCYGEESHQDRLECRDTGIETVQHNKISLLSFTPLESFRRQLSRCHENRMIEEVLNDQERVMI
ncbi:hypothetical protein E1301_Tti004592 [Triplophysa tibetana]|uniref:Uncharacterized protein n=1 Tax=Triplophysa tibetana TaxID=1572043 RepID=A0A5A9N7X4_9TELE|nr:hypothetical protein E1301_Tti004592 [Triplophysa tibetana]